MPPVQHVLRQSHRKSTRGCQTCKRRHVNQKCINSRRECVYLVGRRDAPSPGANATLTWPNVIEQACHEWKQSGKPPFPRLAIAAAPSWHNMPLADLRYLYHMALVDGMLALSGTSNMCLLWGEMRIMIQLATSFGFVAHTLAATSAERLAVLTKSQEAANDGARYRALALHGLSREIQLFSKSNADAILSAYLGCSFIMADYRAVMTVTKSIVLVAARMQHWSEQSAFRHLFDYDRLHRLQDINAESPAAETRPRPRQQNVDNLLAEGVHALNKLSNCLRHNLHLAAVVRQLRDVLRLVDDKQNADIPTPTQYRLIHPFISWYNRNEASSYVAISERDPAVLVFLLYMYSAFVSLAVALPATNLPLFTAIRFRAIVEINRAMEERAGFPCTGCNVFHQDHELAPLPLLAMQVYQSHRAVY
ncbi:Zn(2)-Cys(6) zinc finger domain protein [Metarhizium robertsii]|uniref:Zn(2)-Cys(6) zinc finger domain protein n=1 Tax=Metarhizium robertsii TaxID=568076 RepID=A0A0A1UMP7_9HYPO|nr:Zn(2)-Cys(6) zinc finger domain protein [Metarhizium robertsii]